MIEPLKGIPLSQPLRGWFERLTSSVNNSVTKVSDGTEGNIATLDSDGNYEDSGKELPDGELADVDYVDEMVSLIEETIEQWVAERFITDAPLDESVYDPYNYFYSEELTDDSVFILPEITNGGRGILMVGADDEHAEFSISSTGTVTIITSSDNITINADTDTKFCIGTAATQNPLVIKNRLGSAKRTLLRLWYN